MFTQLYQHQDTARAPAANHARAVGRALAINHSRAVVAGFPAPPESSNVTIHRPCKIGDRR
jgi:hypothetical protein